MKSTATTRDDLAKEFDTVVTDTEHLLKSLATAGGEKAQAMRSTVEENLKTARERLRALEQAAEERARAAVKSTDQYVHGHPWQSIAIAAGLSAIVGIVVGLLLNRKQ
jgi:ElaB/YqjD/DUF883 family membrane-anchored ribosome-binding protein